MWYTGAVLCGSEINVGSLFPLYPESVVRVSKAKGEMTMLIKWTVCAHQVV